MNWKKFKEEKPSEGEEVLAYHPSWIDEDFNPRGIDRRRATARSCSMGRKYESNERLFLGENRRGFVL